MLNINKPEEIWTKRRKSWLIKCCMNNGGFKPKQMAKYLGITEAYFNTKLARDSWCFEDILIAMEYAGLKMLVVNADGSKQTIRFKDWFKDTNPEILKHFEEIKIEELKIEEAYRLIEKKQSEIEEIKRQLALLN